ncbi:MAG: hypothetical protein ACOX0C_02335 [Patescibacteria group bacterium]
MTLLLVNRLSFSPVGGQHAPLAELFLKISQLRLKHQASWRSGIPTDLPTRLNN